MNSKTLTNIFKGDKVVWMIFFFLCLISIVEVFSASSQLMYKGGNYLAPIMKHIGILFVGFVCMVMTLNVPCRYFKVLTPFLLVIAFLSLIYVLLAGESVNGSQRWVSFIGIQFQPSEIAKGTMILATAQILSAMQTANGADKNAFKYILIVWTCIVPFIFLENFSTAALLSSVILMMMIIGRVPMNQIGKLMGVVALLGIIAFAGVMTLGHVKAEDPNKNLTEQVAQQEEESHGVFASVFHRADTWKARIMKFTNNKPIPPDSVDLDKDAQVAHSNIAVATSNVVGKGPGNSVERDFLSQAFSDFIYAIIIEEMGIEGAFFVALLYIILLFRTGRIANRCENNFPALLAMGLALLLVTQALFNMCVAVGLAPVTGQPLPLISKGGTSTIINCIYLGAILSVSRTAKKMPESNDEKASATIAI
jgi:cell division protein FtsW